MKVTRVLKWTGMVAAVLLIFVGGFVYAGLFNVAADHPHWGVTFRLLEAVRERSVAVRARDVEVPVLDDPKLLARGAEEYEEMCTGCHLAPGMGDTVLRKGLYPKPPNLAERAARRSPAENYWIIKHGLKMSGMPAWGVTHGDDSIWAMVALLERLPRLTRTEYEALIAQAGGSHTHIGEKAGEHAHGGAAEDMAHTPTVSDGTRSEGVASTESSVSHPTRHRHKDGKMHAH